MTVFPDGSKERLHGHNYQVELAVDLRDVSFANLVDFAPLKHALADLCAAWRERVLLAERNPHFVLVGHSDRHIEFVLCERRYLLPAEDVLLLPIENVVVEQLAALVAQVLRERLGPLLPHNVVAGLEVTVLESPGQGARVHVPFP